MAGPGRETIGGAIAPLRAARRYMLEKNTAAAVAEYEQVRANADYLPHHRAEAAESIRELDRIGQGLPARDPAASRMQVPRVATAAAEVWVAPDGNDANPGTEDQPFATLARARDAVSALPAAAGTGARIVRIRPGEYPLRETFALAARDSGTPAAPIVYRAERKGTAVFHGGTRINGFAPVPHAPRSPGQAAHQLPVEECPVELRRDVHRDAGLRRPEGDRGLPGRRPWVRGSGQGRFPAPAGFAAGEQRRLPSDPRGRDRALRRQPPGHMAGRVGADGCSGLAHEGLIPEASGKKQAENSHGHRTTTG